MANKKADIKIIKGKVKYDSKDYIAGTKTNIIKDIDEKTAKRLIGLKVAEKVDNDEEETDYSKMKIDELRDIAKEKEIEGYSNMKKDELITALEEMEVEE